MSMAIIVHGGAGTITPDRAEIAQAGCREAVLVGWRILQAGGSALDAVEAQLVHDRRLALVVERQGSALDGGHVLVGMEAERDDVARRPHRAARGARSDREGGVLEDAQLVAPGESVEGIGIERRVVMRRKQQACLRRDRGLRLREIDVARG